MTLFGLLVIGVTGRFVGRLILQPIDQLRTGAVRIGQGDYNYQIDLKRQDEMGQVAQAFNEMVIRIRQRDEEIAERTFELKESEERFALAVRGVGAGIWGWAPKTGKGWSSERFKKLLGYDDHDLDESFSNIVNITHPDYREAVAASL